MAEEIEFPPFIIYVKRMKKQNKNFYRWERTFESNTSSIVSFVKKRANLFFAWFSFRFNIYLASASCGRILHKKCKVFDKWSTMWDNPKLLTTSSFLWILSDSNRNNWNTVPIKSVNSSTNVESTSWSSIQAMAWNRRE